MFRNTSICLIAIKILQFNILINILNFKGSNIKNMKKIYISLLLLLIVSLIFVACGNTSSKEQTSQSKTNESPFVPTAEFKDYWYASKAEISSYKLTQARYGEMREGTAVLIFVTEDFLPGKQVKADNYDKKNTAVLKLNSTKNFNTGIYPYSIMQSSFYPVTDDAHAIKLSASVQEWCGQAYTQLNNRKLFDVMTHSYFENEADKEEQIAPSILENELWNRIRIRPELLPVGEQTIIPSLEYCRLMHKEIKSYKATATLLKSTETYNYTIIYPELNRDLSILFSSKFPYEILSWSETYPQGSAASAKKMTTTATKINQVNVDYWTKNKNEHLNYRDSLGLK